MAVVARELQVGRANFKSRASWQWKYGSIMHMRYSVCCFH